MPRPEKIFFYYRSFFPPEVVLPSVSHAVFPHLPQRTGSPAALVGLDPLEPAVVPAAARTR
jgi:hypothetical protein